MKNNRISRTIVLFAPFILSVCASADFQNGDFTQIGANGNPWTTVGQNYGPGDESAAAHWTQFVPTPGGVLTSEIVFGFGPDGSNALHVTTNTGSYDPLSFGSGVNQNFADLSNPEFS